MSRATSPIRDLAQRIMVHEGHEGKSSQVQPTVAFHACEKLRPHLATLMGDAGARALFARSLVIAHSEAPWLRTVHVQPAGSSKAFEFPEAPVGRAVMAEGERALLAQLLGLLVIFIGESLTLRMVRQVWPALPLNDFDFGGGKRNEKAS